MLFSSLTDVLQCFLHFLKYDITEASPASLVGSALGTSRSVLELGGTGYVQHAGSILYLLTKATPVAP